MKIFSNSNNIMEQKIRAEFLNIEEWKFEGKTALRKKLCAPGKCDIA